MPTFAAGWIGNSLTAVLAHHGQGRVHSVFARACNLMLADGTFVALLHPELPQTPWGLRLAVTPPPFHTLLEPGQNVTVDAQGHGLKIEVSAGEGVHVSHAGAVVWEADLPPLFISPAMADAALRVLQPLLEAALPPRRHGNELEARVQQALAKGRAQLHAALAAANPEQTVDAARRLLGLGPGLTPSGDDMLAGLLAALWVFEPPAALPNAPLTAVREALAHMVRREAPGATHPVSAVFLTHAAEGLFAEHVRDVLLALDAPAALPAAASRLLAFGASSGADTLAGLCLGLEAACR